MWPFRKKKAEGKYPSTPIYYSEPIYYGRNRVRCPYCGSDRVGSAGYANRLECQNCGKIFT